MSDDNQTDDTVDNQTDTTIDWKQALSETIRDDASITKFDDIESLAKSYISAQNMIGRDKIAMPQSDDEFRDVYKRLGMPDGEEDYKFTDVEFPEGIKAPEETGVGKLAHSLGLNNEQADKFNTWYLNNMLNMAQNAQEAKANKATESMSALQKEFGDATKGNIELAKRVLNDYGDDSSKEFLESTGLGNDANILRVFAKIGGKLVEDRVMEGHSPSGDSPSSLKSKISELQSKPGYFDKSSPDHKNLIGQVEGYYKQLYPE